MLHMRDANAPKGKVTRRKRDDGFDGHPPPERPRWVNNDQEWKPKVQALAAELGFESKSAWFWYRQVSLEVFHMTRWPQECADAWAFECIRRSLDKRGQVGS